MAACGVQDTELELDTLEGVLETPEAEAALEQPEVAASSSEPGQLGPRWDESEVRGPYSGCEDAELVTIGGRGSRLTEVEAVLVTARLVLDSLSLEECEEKGFVKFRGW